MQWNRGALIALFSGVVVLMNWLGWQQDSGWLLPSDAQASTKKSQQGKERPRLGTLVISSSVVGALVWVGNDKLGETTAGGTLIRDDLKPGSYWVRARKAGYQRWERKVQVSADKRTEVVLDMKLLKSRPEPPQSEQPLEVQVAATELKNPRGTPRIGLAPRQQRPAPSQIFREIIEQIQQHFVPARIAFNMPTSLRRGETIQIELLLSLHESIDELIEKLKRRSVAIGEKEGADIRVSHRMEARLTGPGFTITAITPEQQLVGVLEATEWKWNVKAVTSGQQLLHLTLAAIFFLENSQTTLAVRTFDKHIDVTVSWYKPVSSFIGDNWQWLWTALLVPVVGWLWAWYFRRKNSDDPIS
jgi:hypothetical protein